MDAPSPHMIETDSQPPVGEVPEWNLSQVYQDPEDPAIRKTLREAMDRAVTFRDAYRDRLAELSGRELGEAVEAYEVISEAAHKAIGYAQLLSAADVSDPVRARFLQTMQEKVNDIFSETLFFALEINRIPEEVLEEQLKDPKAARYAPWLNDMRVYRKHQLSDELEQLLHDKSVTGRSAWSRLFEEQLAFMRFDLDGEKKTLSDVLNNLSDKDAALRERSALSLSRGLTENIHIFTLVTNVLAKDKETEDLWREYPRPISARNLGNQVEDEVVEALVNSIKGAYETLGHRYYQLKARWFGVDKLNWWDRNAPLPDIDERLFTWDEARETVLSAYHAFEPEMARVAKRFFDEEWIDARLRPGKNSGAFSHSLVPSVHPYILMNFHGKSRDVMTLAHELGHGVHQVLAADQGMLMANTPLTLAETASVFGEMLTFRSLLERETDPARRRVLLAGKVEDMMNTVVRQVAFHQFEEAVHAERPNGELSADRLGEIWLDVQRQSLGPAFRFDDDYRCYWAYIPHFVHAPFYVYAYAFGDCLVNSLYDTFQKGFPGFQSKYLEMLRAGGTLRHKELLAPFGLDASDPDFWRRGLGVISGFIDELEQTL
ncbi:MAG: M3 family oligoendopeptidase [Magnetovibrionaceae bacterium]